MSGHLSVLLQETVDGLAVKADGRYVDGTLGGGGHAEEVLKRLGPQGRLLGIDQDPEALERVARRLAPFGDRFRAVHGNFEALRRWVGEAGWETVDGVMLDLGVSSNQLDTADRGFSFRAEGPLDMRMDPENGLRAADWVAGTDEAEMIRVFRAYGEEPSARRVAQALCRARMDAPIQTTTELAEIVEKAKGGRRGRIHPATRVFQAIRIAVNRELEVLEQGLDAALDVLAPGGRLAVISFHSLEDRIAKRFMVRHVGREESLQQGGSAWRGEEPRMRRITRRPIVPGEEEQAANPRARSAKLRIAERMK